MPSRLLEMAVHELRNPLTGVSALLELLSHNLRSGRAPDPEALELVETAQGEIRRLSMLLGRLLEAERTGGMAFSTRREPCDLREVIKAAVRPMLRGAHSIILESDDPGPLPLMADRSRLEQVFRNLLGNAAKYSPAESVIRITLRQDAESVRITIQDQGIGIPPAEIEQIFESFYRASNLRDRDHGGIGVGLYICRQIVEAHDGKIWAESGPGGGAAFHVQIPNVTKDTWLAY